VQSLLSLLVTFCFQPMGFANKDLRARFAQLLGVPLSAMTQGRMTYQLRRLRLRGFIERIKGSHRYRVTSTGMRIAIFAAKLHARILRPGLSKVLGDAETTGDLRRTLRSIDSALNSLVANARLAG
jgi:predicted MarR family transcription regulator